MQVRNLEFSFNAQDRLTLAPAARVVKNVNDDLSTDKIQLTGGLEANQGRYVYPLQDPRFIAANAFSGVDRTINTFLRAWGDPIAWATGKPKLTVTPDAEGPFNSFYDRDMGGLFFFHTTDPVTHETVYAADSGEVVAHETAHALLDAIHPHYFDGPRPDPAAFHESFGDVMALICSLQSPPTVALVCQETQGDMRQPNSAAAWAEEVGATLNHLAGHDVTGGHFVRNARNDFVWQEPASLPSTAPPGQLSSEAHSYSRLWTGAMYDFLGARVSERIRCGQWPGDALPGAAQDLLELQVRALKQAPEGDFTFREMALSFLAAENNSNCGKYSGLLHQIFENRKILRPEDPVQPPPPEPGTYPLRLELEGARFGKFQGATWVVSCSGTQVPLASRQKELLDFAAAAVNGNNLELMRGDNQAVVRRRPRS